MRRSDQIRRSAGILSGWKLSACKAIYNGESTVTLVTCRLTAPSGSHQKLCQSCGPIGVVLDITPQSGRHVVVAKYSAMAVRDFCDKQLDAVLKLN